MTSASPPEPKWNLSSYMRSNLSAVVNPLPSLPPGITGSSPLTSEAGARSWNWGWIAFTFGLILISL